MIAAAESLSPRRVKLRPPRLPEDMVVRPRLLARLNRMATLSLIIAPAGYGKTTLVGSWLVQTALPFGWLALGEGDNDPAMFLAGLVAAIATIYAGFGDDILASLSAPQSAPFADLAMRLINQINELGDEFILVLDDYHTIRQPQIHQLLVDLVAYPPRAMHLVIMARHDPPLPWRVRNRSSACELRAADLSFTGDEAEKFLSKAADRSVTAADAHAYVHQAQGWITSLRIRALVMRLHTAETPGDEMASTGFHEFSDYFDREVLAGLGPELLTFLVRTSILDVLCGPLCDAVAPIGDEPSWQADHSSGRSSSAVLQELVSVGAFTEAMDDEGVWYRYHPLLRDVLRRRLAQTAAATEIAGLYIRASGWHEEHNLLDEALTYALAGGQVQRAVDLMQRHRQQLLNGWEWARVERWLRQFPTKAIDSHVELVLTRAWINQWRYNLADVRADLEQIKRLFAELPPDTPRLNEWRSELATLQSQQYVSLGDADRAMATAQLALANLPPGHLYVRTVAVLQLVMACQMTGEWERALAYIAGFVAGAAGPRDLTMALAAALRAYVDLPATNLPATRTSYATMIQIVTTRGMKTNLPWVHYFWAATSYLQNDLRGAEEHFRAVVEAVDSAHAVAYTHSAIGLALTYQAQGRCQEAEAVIEGAQKRLAARQQHHVLEWAEAFAAELAARQGRVDEALRWVARKGRKFEYDAMPLFYIPGLAFVRVLLAGGSTAELLAAQYWLELELDRAQRVHNAHAQIQCLVLDAALCEAQGMREKALASLAAALAQAAHGQIVRVFADLATQLAPLFEGLAAGEPLSGFALRVYNAIMLENQAAAAQDKQANSLAANQEALQATAVAGPHVNGGPNLGNTRSGGELDLRELLTYREMDVLKLLEQRLTNKEIAHVLGISTETVRQHTVNLFRKLNVGNRRQAIVVAHSLGYIGSPAPNQGRSK